MGSWAHGMFSCCHDLSTCCIASFLPCVTFGQTAEMSGQGSCCCYGLLAFVPCLSIFLLCQQRGIIREKEDIPVSWNTLFFIPKLRHPSGFQFFQFQKLFEFHNFSKISNYCLAGIMAGTVKLQSQFSRPKFRNETRGLKYAWKPDGC